VPQFCRHNRFVANCPICSKELVPPEPPPPARRSRGPARRAAGAPGGVRVRQGPRPVAGDFDSPLVPGLRSSEDARLLARELGFAAARLAELAADPPGLYADVGGEGDVEEAAWLAFLIAYLSPGEGQGAWDALAAARVPWHGGEAPRLERVAPEALGPRAAHDPARGGETVVAYRRWAERAGSQEAAYTGEEHWAAERRFARAFERLSLPGFGRDARFDLLVTLGRTGRFPLRADSLFLAAAPAESDLALGARRVFGIADPLLIDRRAAALAAACEVPFEALDLALYNWQRGEESRATLGAGPAARTEQSACERVERALAVAAEG
jgi:hypothetical protein